MKDKINELIDIKTQLVETIGHFSSQRREEKLFDKWSLKDVLAHLNIWMIHDIDCLKALREGKEPYWEPDIDEFNTRGVDERKNKNWNEVFKEFEDLSHQLIEVYKTLPNELWNKPIWKGRKQTAKRFLYDDIGHWRDEHLMEIKGLAY